ECWLDGDAPAACASPFTAAALPDGEHQFFVRAKRGAVVDRTPARADFGIDTIPPDTQITGGPPSFTFRGEEGGGSECRIAPAAFAKCAAPMQAPGAPGDYVFEVRALDAAGNADPTPAARAFTIVGPGGNPPTPPPGPAPGGLAPHNLSLPTITKVGPIRGLYACNEGGWDGASAYTYAWYRAYSLGKPVLVGTEFGYTVPDAYWGYTFYCVVTAKNAYGSTQAVSAWTVLPGLPDVPPERGGRLYGNVQV